MKPGILNFLLVAIIISGCSGSASMAKKEKAAAEFERTAALLESGSYMFSVRSASPAGGKTIQLTSPYSLEANDGNYEAYLPYFGRAYSASFGDSGGIEFNGAPENLQITRDDQKLSIAVSFTIQAEKDSYSVDLKVGPSGFGKLLINSKKQQSISYSGQAVELRD